MIKFRSYDKSTGEMISPEETDFFNEDGKLVSYYFAGHKHPLYKSGHDIKVYCELMQFTGINDIKGNEIYEGDVVNGGIYNGSYKYGIIVREGREFYAIPVGRFSEGVYKELNRLEVIGNIYQNSELI